MFFIRDVARINTLVGKPCSTPDEAWAGVHPSNRDIFEVVEVTCLVPVEKKTTVWEKK